MLTTKETLIYIVISICLMAVGVFIGISSRCKKVLNSWIVRKLSHHEYPGKKDTDQHRSIYNLLVGLRAVCDSDRAYVIRFHNGHEFLISDPIWKCTCTHEVVRSGVTYESVNIQNLLISRISELIDPIISGNYFKGCFQPGECSNCQYKSICKRTQKNMCIFQVEDMSSGYAKFFLQDQNIKTMIVCGLTSKRGPFGMVGIDITSSDLTDTKKLNELSSKICQAAEKIQFMFLKKGLRKTGTMPIS